MVKGVIFDMDGVLIDTETFYMEQRGEFLQSRGISQGDGMRFFGATENSVWQEIVPDEEMRAKLRREYLAYQQEHPTPYARLVDVQVKEVFARLRELGIKTAIASSSHARDIQTVMAAAGISDMVDFYISGESCRQTKPAPEIYLRAMEALGLDGASAIAVEDSPIGIEAAVNAGLKVYALLPKKGYLNQERAAAKIRELKDIFKYI